MLPSPGQALPFFYLSLIAVENDEVLVFRDLLETIYSNRREEKWSFFMAGLHTEHPLAEELKRFRHIPMYGNLYVVHWEDGAKKFDELDGRTPYIELAAL